MVSTSSHQNSVKTDGFSSAEWLTDQAVRNHKEGKIEEAIAYYSELVELQPDGQAWMYGNLITLLTQAENFEEGSTIEKKALEIHSESDEVFRALGGLHSRKLDTQKSIDYFERAIDLVFKQPEWVFTQLAQNLYHQTQNSKAIEIARKGISIYPRSYWLYSILGDALQKEYKWREAYSSYKKAFELNEDLSSIRDKLDMLARQYSLDEDKESKLEQKARLIAFFLPQFHPIPENDEWWGKGFTEWTNVSKAQPWFKDHYQPHLPADLGFYDLRLSEIREAQANLAKEYGIHGFCYYYYWFNGKRLLERPLEEILKSKQPDFPFCICWANENWSRRWDGRENDVLVEQNYNPQSLKEFAESVVPYLSDSRYINIVGKPLLLIYRLTHIPNPEEAIQIWREVFHQSGIGEVYIAGVLGFGLTDPVFLGCDAGVQFPPNSLSPKEITPSGLENIDFPGKVYDYQYAVKESLKQELPEKIFPGVMPSWDNTARRQKEGTVWLNSSPEQYKLWLKGSIEKIVAKNNSEEQIVFINAWNEWAEGAHIEPDKKYGHDYLKATQTALDHQCDWKTIIQLLKYVKIDRAKQVEKLLIELENSIDNDCPLANHVINEVEEEDIIINTLEKVDSIKGINQEYSLIYNLESPEVGTGLDENYSFIVSGWVLSKPHEVVAIAVVANNTLIHQQPLNMNRADVTEAFPDYQCESNGFYTTVTVDETIIAANNRVDLEIQVIHKNSSTKVLAKGSITKTRNNLFERLSTSPFLTPISTDVVSRLTRKFNQKPTLFILHDIASAGAQLFLVRLLEWIKRQNNSNPENVLGIEILVNIPREHIHFYGEQGQFVLERLEECGVVYFLNSYDDELPENINDIRKSRYSCIYVNSCVLGTLLDKIAPISSPVIVHVHELTFWIKYRLGIDNFQKLLKYDPHIIACSNAVKNNLVEVCDVQPEKIETIHAFVPTETLIKSKTKTRQEIRETLDIPLDTFVIVGCGTLDWRKGADMLIPLVVLLQEKLPVDNFVFLWIGGWQTDLSKNEMEFAIDKAGLKQNLILTGYKTDPINYLEAGDVFALLSREDPFPLVMSEAAICKLPVVGFAGSGGVTEFVEGGAGFAVPYLNLNKMTKAIYNLYQDRNLAKEMGRTAYEKVHNLYSENVLAPKIADAIARLSSVSKTSRTYK